MELNAEVEAYLAGFMDLLKNILVSDGKSQEMSFPEGIHHTIDILQRMDNKNGKIMFVGNGGSAAIASHFAIDYWHAGGLRAMDFNSGPLLTCITNDHGYESVFSIPIEKFGEPGDVLIAISSSGNSKNILNAVAAARNRSCKVVTLSGFQNDNALKRLGDLNFYVPISHYGYVELTHKVILHCVLDILKEQSQNNSF